jgi:hypothetical protein
MYIPFNELVQGISGRQAHTLANINETAWRKLVCSVHLLKHKTLFSSERIDLLHRSMSTTPLPQDKTRLLKWLAYSDIAALDTLAKWHDFVCRQSWLRASPPSKIGDEESVLATFLTSNRSRCSWWLWWVYK